MMQNKWRVWIYSSFIMISLLSCSGSSDKEFSESQYGLDLESCSLEIQNEFVHRAMQDRYFWYQTVPDSVDYSTYLSPDAVVKTLRKQPEDRFSYVATATSFDSLFEDGQYTGFGFGYFIDDNHQVWFRFVYTDSPAGKAGIQRGDEIVAIDGQTMDVLVGTNSSGNPTLGSAFGSATLGLQRSLTVKRNGVETTYNLTKATVTMNTVLAADTINHNSQKYAYLAFKSFIYPSYDELETAFAQFKSDGANKLILDLRYNGGGSISVAENLGSYIYKPNEDNSDIFVQLKFNDKYPDEDYDFYFEQLSNSLDLDEVIVLTTEASCSASEMVINSLRPFVNNVTVIGSTTCGKPIGMRSQNFCDKKLVAINFKGFNASNQGDYFDGISADCAAQDDVSFALGDSNEPMLKAALDFDSDGTCLAASSRRSGQSYSMPSYSGLKDVYQSE